jgi:sortase A
MRPVPDAAPRQTRLRRQAGQVLIAAGLAAIGWGAFVLVDSLFAHLAGRVSLAVMQSGPPLPDAPPPGGAPPMDEEDAGAPVVPSRGESLAMLSIPRLNLSAVVLHGADDVTLRRGPGHLEGTTLPGLQGNAVIAGHRDTFFASLRRIAVGDDVYIDNARGRVHYRVTSMRVVRSQDLRPLEPTAQATLTLVTCYPFWVLGAAPDRFVVRATRIGEPPSLLPDAPPPSQGEP